MSSMVTRRLAVLAQHPVMARWQGFAAKAAAKPAAAGSEGAEEEKKAWVSPILESGDHVPRPVRNITTLAEQTSDVMTRPDEEYPEWLWSLTDPKPPFEELPMGRQKMRAERKMRIKANNVRMKLTKGM